MQATRIAIAPSLSRLITAGETRATEALYHGATRGVILASWPLYIGLACFAPTILRIFGHDFSRGGTALTILAAAMLVDVGTGNVGSVLLMGGGSRWNLLNSATGLVVDVVIDVLLIPTHGPVGGAVGAAIGWAASIVVINLMACLEVHYLMGLRIVDAPTVRLATMLLGVVAVPGVLLAIVGDRSVVALAMWIVVTLVGVGGWVWRNRRHSDVTELLAAARSMRPSRPDRTATS
jgi:O-antigen/teichoic acid export membrane protein